MDLNPEFVREIEKLRARFPTRTREIDRLMRQIVERPAEASIAWQDDIHWITESLKTSNPPKAKLRKPANGLGRRIRRDRSR
jgi:hypothetical protein